jgi:hypothetical protein
MTGKICHNNICVDAQYITTTWSVDQVEQVLTLSAVYAPYRIARIVKKRTYDTYQIVYHADYFRKLVTFLKTPRSKIVCGNTEIPASFISTIWDCTELGTAVSLLLQGYSYNYVARRVHKRTADVKSIRDHLSYFIDILDQLYQNVEGYPGIITHVYEGVQYEAPFEVPGIWTLSGLCNCYYNNECYSYVMKYHRSNWLVVIYLYESRDGKLVTYDVFRGVSEWWGVTDLIGQIAQTVGNFSVGFTQTDLKPTIDVCKVDDIIKSIQVT